MLPPNYAPDIISVQTMYDVIVDGVSLALNYRAQFEQIIRNASYDTLLQKIKSKVEHEASEGEVPTGMPVGMQIRAKESKDRESIIG